MSHENADIEQVIGGIGDSSESKYPGPDMYSRDRCAE